MTETVMSPKAKVALLCIGEADGDGALSAARVFGQPLVHHLIKQLESQGISRFFIGVENVSGALLTYGDFAKASGLDVQFVREPKAFAAVIDAETEVLVIRADTILSRKLLADLLNEPAPYVATVEEHAENKPFERIDLNRRWAGLALVTQRSLDNLAVLPEGWDMASALLRQAIQDKCRFFPIRQAEVQSGNIRRLMSEDDLRFIQTKLGSDFAIPDNSLEKSFFEPLALRLTNPIWTVPWGRTAVEWLFPFASLGSALLAVFKFPVAAVLVAIAAIFAEFLRKGLRLAEYRQGQSDWAGMAGWALLVAALVAFLQGPGSTAPEAAFLGLALLGLSLIDAEAARPANPRVLSPLVIALWMLPGVAVGAPDWAARLLILVGLGMSLYRLKKRVGPNETAN